MAYLTLKNINKIYPNGYHAVHNFNLEIEKGETSIWKLKRVNLLSSSGPRAVANPRPCA